MAEDYSIISAHSTDGAAVSIPVSWQVNNPETDLLVYISGGGEIGVCNTWAFDADNGAVKVSNPQGLSSFSVFIFRIESASMLEDLVADKRIAVSSILAQLAKNVRCLEQLQVAQDTFLRTPDGCGILPEAGERAGKILCFGDDGQPVVNVAYIDVLKVREYREAAEKAYADGVALYEKATAEGNALLADTEAAAKNAQAAQKSANADANRADNYKNEAYDILLNVQNSNNEVDTMLSMARTAKTAAEAAQTAAETAKTNASNYAASASDSKTAAASAKVAAEAAKADAVSAKESIAADKVSVESAKVDAQNAKSAAQAAQAAAELAKNQAQEIVDPDNRIGKLFQTKLDKGVLYCDGGFAKVPQGAFTTLSKATMLIRFARKGAPTSLETLCALGDGGTTQTGFLVRLTTDARFSVLCYFKKADGTGSDGPHVVAYNIAEYLDGKIHAFALCWSGTQTRIFIDGELKGQSAVSAAGMTVQSGTPGISFGARATTSAEYFRGRVSDFAVLNYDASEVDSDGNYTSAYSIADYQNGAEIPPWSVPVVFGNGKSATANTTNAACVWDGANWSMTQTSNAATIKSMLYYIPLNIGQKLRIKFSNLTGGVLADGKYGFFQPVRQEADQINVSTTSLDAEFTATTQITLWRFQFNCAAVSDEADRVATVFENFTVERDGAVVALENYTIARNTTTKLIKDASGNGNDATVSGVLAGDRDNAIAAFVDELKTQINQQA